MYTGLVSTHLEYFIPISVVLVHYRYMYYHMGTHLQSFQQALDSNHYQVGLPCVSIN